MIPGALPTATPRTAGRLEHLFHHALEVLRVGERLALQDLDHAPFAEDHAAVRDPGPLPETDRSLRIAARPGVGRMRKGGKLSFPRRIESGP